MSLKYPIEYGWCNADHKSGLVIRSDYPRDDYMFSPEYSEAVEDMFEKLCLPYPKEDEVYRGTCHDMLFLENHGVVVRVGPCDLEDMINPYILQPLGWMNEWNISVSNEKLLNRIINDKFTFGVSIYPGINPLMKYGKNMHDSVNTIADLSENILNTGQLNKEVRTGNIGIVELDNGEEASLLLDSDNHYNMSIANNYYATERNKAHCIGVLDGRNSAEIMGATISSVFTMLASAKAPIKAFNKHQPLRHLFAEACNMDGEVDKPKMEAFWDKCAEVSINPEVMDFPVWKVTQTGEYIRQGLQKAKVELQRPWKVSLKP